VRIYLSGSGQLGQEGVTNHDFEHLSEFGLLKCSKSVDVTRNVILLSVQACYTFEFLICRRNT
jgi:hypothetical protein